ncbi:hypothetical protein BH23ACT10_BH23ACT10_15370 [soil metagenome]
MTIIQVRHVPDEVHAVYRRRAALAGMSLQEFLLGELCDNARHRTPAEIAAEISDEVDALAGSGFSKVSSVTAIRSDRDTR